MRIREYLFEPEIDGTGKRLLLSRFDMCLALFLTLVLLADIAYFSLPSENRTLSKSAALLAILGIGLIPRRRRVIYGFAFAVGSSRFFIAALLQQQHRLELAAGFILMLGIAAALLKEYF